MNTIKQHALLFLLALASLSSLPGCSADDLPGSSPEGANSAPASSFQIHVTDGGYASADAKPGTRAEEKAYKTVFTADDKIGVFAVKGDQIVNEVNNLCLTAKSSNNGIVWQKDDGTDIKFSANATYYAYYPYQQSLTGSLSPNTSDAAGFFANVISSWSIDTDQDAYDKYMAQDLMIAKGTLSGKELSFSMQHQMALVVIDLPKVKYIFDNTSPNISEYIIDTPGTDFSNFKPYRMSDGTYRYLVKPGTKEELSGSYTKNGATKATWKFEATITTLGNYKVFKVDQATVTEISHTLTVGDFYMKDGSLLAGSTNPLTKEQQAACIGIVFWVGSKAFDEDPLLKKDHPHCSHGLVVALHDAALNSITTMNWSQQYESVQNSEDNSYKNSVNIQKNNIMCGYSNTLALKAYNTKKGAGNELRVLPCDAIEQYSNNNPAPANSSGWYFPSVMELQYVCWGQGQGRGVAGRDNLNSYINKVSGTQFVSGGYWSSTEDSNRSDYAWGVYFDDGYMYYNYKYYSVFRVRPLLAF